MIQENLDEEINPRDIEDAGTSSDRQRPEKNEEEEEQGWDILPSNGPGLGGDDGKQVVDYDEDDFDEDEDEDDE